MKKLGILMTALGFVLGSFFLVSRGENVGWNGYALGLFLSVVGVVLLRRAEHHEHSAEEKLQANIGKLRESIDFIAKEMIDLDEKKASIDVYDLPKEIDTRFFPELDHFVESRKSLIHAYNLEFYANVMSHFASGERHLNRAWSCSVDGYVDEAHLSLANAREQFDEVKRKVEGMDQA